MRHKANDGVV